MKRNKTKCSKTKYDCIQLIDYDSNLYLLDTIVHVPDTKFPSSVFSWLNCDKTLSFGFSVC